VEYLEPIELLFGTFPREFSRRRYLIDSKIEFFRRINHYNGITNCYAGLYSIPEKRGHDRAIIDKVYYDLDSSGSWNKIREVHKELVKRNIMHYIQFTGGGFGLFIFTNSKRLKNPKSALRNYQIKMAKQLNMTIGKPMKADVDEHVVGDIARITRIPNTFNAKKKRQLYCIPIIEEDFNKSFDEIKDMAKKQRILNAGFLFGEKFVSLLEFDKEQSLDSLMMKDVVVREVEDKNVQEILSLLPPLIVKLLQNRKDGWRDRYIQVIAMKELGFPKGLASAICRKFWSREKFYHYLVEEDDQFTYVWNRGDIYFPNWDTLQREGYYVSPEDRKFKFYR